MSKLFVVFIFSIFVFNGYHVIEATGTTSGTKVKVYFSYGSPPSRAVVLTLKALNISYELEHIDLVNKEQKKPEFLKMNPLGHVPVIEDKNGFILWESHAIIPYLFNKYNNNEDRFKKLYPKEPEARAKVDQMLHYDNGVFYVAFWQLTVKAIFKLSKEDLPKENVEDVKNCYDFLNKFLEGKNYITGDAITIADFSIVNTLTNASVYVPINDFPQLTNYLNRCKKNMIDFEELYEKGKKKVDEDLKRYWELIKNRGIEENQAAQKKAITP